MIIVNIGKETELFKTVEENLEFLGFEFSVKKAWSRELLEECVKHDYEFASSYYMPKIRKLNFSQAVAFVEENPKVLRKFIVIDEVRHKAVADFPKIGLVRKTLKKTFGRNQ